MKSKKRLKKYKQSLWIIIRKCKTMQLTSNSDLEAMIQDSAETSWEEVSGIMSAITQAINHLDCAGADDLYNAGCELLDAIQ